MLQVTQYRDGSPVFPKQVNIERGAVARSLVLSHVRSVERLARLTTATTASAARPAVLSGRSSVRGTSAAEIHLANFLLNKSINLSHCDRGWRMPAARRGSRGGRFGLQLRVPPEGALLQLNEKLIDRRPPGSRRGRAALVPDVVCSRLAMSIHEQAGCSEALGIRDTCPEELQNLSVRLTGGGIVGSIHRSVLQLGQQFEG